MEKIRIQDSGWEKFGSGMEKIRIRDGKNSNPGWKKFESGMKKIRIRDKHPGSATLLLGVHFFRMIRISVVFTH